MLTREPLLTCRLQVMTTRHDWCSWQVVLVRYPHVEQALQQWRPALVVRRFETPVGILLWVLMITSAENAGWPGDVALEGLEEAGLRLPSIVRTSKIATLDTQGIRCIGMLAERDQVRVSTHIRFN